MNQQEQLDAIKDIRNIMERSTRFLSLSGLSGAFVGLLSLVSFAIIYWIFDLRSADGSYYAAMISPDGELIWESASVYVLVFGGVFLLSVLIVLLMAMLNGKRQRLIVWNDTARRFLVNMTIPLGTGGVYIAILLYHGHVALALPATIIFYGLSLINAGKYTFDEIRILGILELLTGLTASLFVEYGLFFWALGFGVLNIIFGMRVYFKYEK